MKSLSILPVVECLSSLENDPGKNLLICKGAAEELLEICTEAKVNGSVVPLTDEIKSDRLIV